jgi:histidinol-phosphate aminotransferase
VRLGFLISDPENIEDLLKVRGPYDVNQFAEVAVSAALKNQSYVKDYLEEVLNKSKPMLEEFLNSKGIKFWPSSANFIFTFPPSPDVVNQKLLEREILVRPKQDAKGNLGLRMGVGTVAQTKKLIKALEEIL